MKAFYDGDGLLHWRQCGYRRHIEPMRSTNIADLRNRLTQYLREVRAGEEIIVRDRHRPIAKSSRSPWTKRRRRMRTSSPLA